MEYSNNCNVSSDQNGNNTIYVSGGSDTRLAIDVANNKSRYYAELAEGYKNEAKIYRDSAKAYSEQNSDVSKAYVDEIETTLRTLIGTKQNAGNYALASEIPTKVSDLQNDSNFLTTVPTATTSALGAVRPDGETIVINNGVISAEFPTRNIGEIVVSTIPLTDAGLHLLDGALLSGSGTYADFVDYIADLYDSGNYTAIFETESNWQTAVTTYGVCGKFVYDSVNNTVRLPKITGFVEGASGTATLGDLTEAGLPNITGSITRENSASTTHTFIIPEDTFGVGSLYLGTKNKTGPSYGTTNYTAELYFDASRSSSIYGNASTVQPQAIKVLYYIVVATSTKTEVEVDIDEIATDLNRKADVDLTNASPTSAFATAMNTVGIRTVVYQTTSNGCEIRVWSDGFKEIFCKQITNASAAAVDISYPTNGTSHAFTAEPALLVNQYQTSSATTTTTARGEGYARSATGFTVYFLAANANISYYACGY